MKKISAISALFVMLLLGQQAQAENINFQQLFKSLRVGAFVDQRYTKYEGVYATILSFHDSAGMEYINVNGGYIKNIDAQKSSPLAQIGLRVDNLLARARSGSWGRKHTNLSPLPTLEFGPFLAVATKQLDGGIKLNYLYGVGLAVGFD